MTVNLEVRLSVSISFVRQHPKDAEKIQNFGEYFKWFVLTLSDFAE